MTKRIRIILAATTAVLLLPLAGLANTQHDARGGEGWWPQSQTR